VDDPSARASDDDREQAVLALREHLVAGRLTLEEFSERVESAYRARTGTDLVAVGSELPATRSSRQRRRRSVWATLGLFAHVVRRGRLRLARLGLVFSGFSDIDLDLREAEVGGFTTTVFVFALFGNVDVYVPERIGIDVWGLTLFGHRRQWGRDAADADAPELRIPVLSLFGTVDVWHVPSDLRGSYRDIIRAVREQQRELPG
jgi:hypothetical protein